MGQHPGCAMGGGQCRCLCHPWTQELMRKQHKPPARTAGGMKRKAKPIVLVAEPPVEDEPPESEVHNTCPKCLLRAKATDQFCRKDGTKLCLGKPCPRCAAPANEPDAFCWQCGWKLADPYQAPPPDIPMTGRPMPQIANSASNRPPDPLPPVGAPTPDLSLPPGAAEILSERHAPGSVTIESLTARAAAEPLPEEAPVEDAILRLRRLAREQGLLPPEIVVR
jgi:hypothetical protein